jgi:hypothetical protein
MVMFDLFRKQCDFGPYNVERNRGGDDVLSEDHSGYCDCDLGSGLGLY